MREDFYYSRFRLALCAIVCAVLGLILASIFVAALSRIEHAVVFAVAFGAITAYIFISLFAKFFKMFFGNTPAISILDDRVLIPSSKNKEIPFSSIQSVKLVRPSGPDGTIGFYALYFEFHRLLENGQYKRPSAVTIPLLLIKVNRTYLLSLIQQKVTAAERSFPASTSVKEDLPSAGCLP